MATAPKMPAWIKIIFWIATQFGVIIQWQRGNPSTIYKWTVQIYKPKEQ